MITIDPKRDIVGQTLFVSPDNEGNVIGIRLKNHQESWSKQSVEDGYWFKSIGPYIMHANHDSWQLFIEGDAYGIRSGYATSLENAKARCELAALQKVLECLEFVD